MATQTTPAGANFLEGLAKDIDVPPSLYEEANSRYLSVGNWLGRPTSTLLKYSPDVYVQGSFRLGTPIKPSNDNEHYDIDLVCELKLGKSQVTQSQLKEMLGKEMKLYAKAHNMKEPGESRRCWTLDYAEGAQFHLDALPAIPDSSGKRLLLEASLQRSEWVGTAIAITDIDHAHFKLLSPNWPHSNPKGFTNWFRSRMTEVYRSQRKAMAILEHASVENIPSYRVRTPLQQAVQVLKRHRDIMFSADPTNKPISVVITTLAGQAYGNEPTVAEALEGFFSRMHEYIEDRHGVVWIGNPTDPQENFADKWEKNPALGVAFRRWVQKARDDFRAIASENNRQRIVEAASTAFGERSAQSAEQNSQLKGGRGGASFRQRLTSVFAPAHKKPVPWKVNGSGSVRIARCVVRQRGRFVVLSL